MTYKNKFLIAVFAAIAPLCGAYANSNAGEVVKITETTPCTLTKNAVKETTFTLELTKDSKERSARVEIPVDLGAFRGTWVHFSADVRATAPTKDENAPVKIAKRDATEEQVVPPDDTEENISKTGIRFGADIKYGPGVITPAANMKYTPYGWQRISFTQKIPSDVGTAKIVMSLSKQLGKVEFKNITYQPFIYTQLALPENFKCEYSDKIKNLPPLRGFMNNGKYKEQDLVDMRKWGANLVRWQLCRGFEHITRDTSIEDYDKWLDEKIAELKIGLKKAEEIGMKVMVDIHTPPGGRYTDREFRMFHEEKYAKYFIEAWKKIARELKDYPAAWCYNIINEPWNMRPAKYDYLTLQYEAAKAIREINPDIPISVESNVGSSADAFRYFSPFPMKDIIYQLHMYFPGHYTHQGVFDPEKKYLKGIFINYPLEGKTAEQCRAMIETNMKGAIDFQQKYGARMYVGEFSVIRWAPGGAEYLEDLLSVFEKHNWDWTYHAFREFPGWSVEHVEDPHKNNVAPQDTLRKMVLLRYLQKNK